MTQENNNWITCLEGDKAVFHCFMRTPMGNHYIDVEVDENHEVKITKNYKSWQK